MPEPTVVCLHSLFLDPRMFDGFAEAAAGRFRVVAPEFRGQGSGVADVSEPVTMDACAADVERLIESLGAGPVGIVAQSMGGDVAVRVAARRPELVTALVLLGSSARAEPQANLDAFRPLVDRIAEVGFTGETLETTMAIMFGETTRADPARADTVALWRERIAALSPALHNAIRGVIERESAVELLARITAPTLVISGDEDIARPPEWSQELAAEIPDAELWALQGVGHSVILEAPEMVTPRMLAFLAEHAQRRA